METNILLPKNYKIIKQEGNRSVFEIENCYPGYGMTLGNAFRRVLLSSLPGAAITSVKIKGINHEFSTIPHVLEDVIQIILNLKQVRFKLYSKEPVVLSLKVKGEKKVKASDIKATSDIEIINQDAHIATLTDKKAELDMEIEAASGLGYLPVEQRKKDKISVGHIAIDAIFTPIKKVNYEIENMRVGERTDFDRLIIDLETDGSINPEEAMQRAAQILVNHFDVFTGEKKDEIVPVKQAGKTEEKKKAKSPEKKSKKPKKKNKK